MGRAGASGSSCAAFAHAGISLPACLPFAQAAWLYRATQEDAYLAAARGFLRRAQV